MSDERNDGIEPYDGPAGGWGALAAVARSVRAQMGASADTRALLRMNQPDGFDCPGCAWPDPRHASSFEFCENGAKAVTWEATTKRATPELFAAHPVAELWGWSDHALEDAGRLTHPMAYDAATDRFAPIAWEAAFERIAAGLNALDHPDQAEFYTSGRTSNEAAFLYQLFARAFGTNNFPDCSNMCHEATSVGLPRSIGVGKGTVTLEDFDHADALICIGHNPGTNHPRMLGTLREVARRGAPIVVVNPMRERGLERFKAPQSPAEMLTQAATDLASDYHLVRVGGDAAMLTGVMKALVAADAQALARGEAGLLDRAFIAEHTSGVEALLADLEAADWGALERRSGLTRAAMENVASVYARAERVIVCYGMGVTQHLHGTQNVQQIANLLLLRGNIGKPGAGICPLRGHSNVQGDRTVGITESPGPALLDGIERVYGFAPPRRHGHDAVRAVAAMADGTARAFIGLGGNLAVAMSDPQASFDAFRRLDLSVNVVTKLNRTCLLLAKETLILPCLGRSETDLQAGGPQKVTVEDSMSMVHASRGRLKPASEHLRSEPAIVAGMARATLPDSGVDWEGMVADYGRIRDGIAAVFPDFGDYNARIEAPGGFRLTVAASGRVWNTDDGKARFLVFPEEDENDEAEDDEFDAPLTLTTLRSHDQYNTTIYGMNDRYRGVSGRRDVLFANAEDMAARGLAAGDRVDVLAGARILPGLTVVDYGIARHSVAAYFPEANVLIGLDAFDRDSGTPGYKSIRVTLRPAR